MEDLSHLTDLTEFQLRVVEQLTALLEDSTLGDDEVIAKFREVVREAVETPGVSKDDLSLLAMLASHFEAGIMAARNLN